MAWQNERKIWREKWQWQRRKMAAAAKWRISGENQWLAIMTSSSKNGGGIASLTAKHRKTKSWRRNQYRRSGEIINAQRRSAYAAAYAAGIRGGVKGTRP
jgi:hypothetical protein